MTRTQAPATEKARTCTSVPLFAEPFEQPALDRVENLQLDGYC
jgi:hypothetical protein